MTLGGDKVVLGFVQAGTENATVCTAFLRGLQARGLRADDGLLVVLDGGKGLHAAVALCPTDEDPGHAVVVGSKGHGRRKRWTGGPDGPAR